MELNKRKKKEITREKFKLTSHIIRSVLAQYGLIVYRISDIFLYRKRKGKERRDSNAETRLQENAYFMQHQPRNSSLKVNVAKS